MSKILKNKIIKKRITKLKNTKFVLGKIKDKIIVKCPNCKTKFFRTSAVTEPCNICETTQTFKAC